MGRIADKAVADVQMMKTTMEAELKVQTANIINDAKIRLMQAENERTNNVLTTKKEE